ncbi:MAG: FkbM family methyltransferase [Mariniblastus sp.]|nr:FkbM family methyltransferase [Mariniblastus sp.]
MKNYRAENLKNYLYLATCFRNSLPLIWAFRNGSSCTTAVLWNGTRLVHPEGRGGLVGTILEVWRERCYTRNGFYIPQDGDQIVDAGAHVGLFSLFMASQNPNCKILSLEPFPENYHCLEKNILSSKATNITALPYALGAESQVAFIKPVGERSIDHLLQTSSDPDSREVQVVSLSDVLSQLQTDNVAMLKMDIEGAEFDVFETASTATLKCFQRIALEYHDNLRPGTLELLEKKLGPTHDLEVQPTLDRGYGILFATRRR